MATAKKAPAKAKGKKTAKAPAKAAKKKAPATAQSKAFDKAFEAWKKGEQISVLAAELKCKRGALRRQLRRRAGGRAEFKALRNQGAGGIRASLGERAAKPNMDAGAKVIPAGGHSHWTHRWVRVIKGKPLDRPLPVYAVGTTGVEYIACNAEDKADVLVEMGNGLPPKRMKLFEQF